MQSVNAAFTAEEHDFSRRIASNLQVSWHKQSTLGNRTFTIGVSTIGGNDAIGINPGAIGSPGNYKYFDESSYLMSANWENGYNMPTGGLTMALGQVILDNTSGRFTPRYIGGNSEISTAILPRRPLIINAGFTIGGQDITIPQFAGLIDYQPLVDQLSRQISLQFADYVDFFQDKYLDQQIMFTAQRTDQVLKTLSTNLGMNTAQFSYDTGINVIPFGLFDAGTKYADIIHQLVEAENGHYYQDETGKFIFENRQHWSNAPYTNVQKVIATAQVINAQVPNQDHLINVVEVNSIIYQKQPLQTVFTLPTLSSFLVTKGTPTDQFFEFQDPVLALTDPTNGGANSYFIANTASDGSGTDVSSSISVQNLGTFAKSVKYRFTTSQSGPVYITQLVLAGRIAKNIGNIYYREQDGSSVTAFQEQVLSINNDYIQNASWAQSYAEMILQDFSNPESLQIITIKAFPELQKGDLISWQGRYWRIFDIKTTLDPSAGFIQQLTLLQRTIVTYFRIGISTIGGPDQIAP